MAKISKQVLLSSVAMIGGAGFLLAMGAPPAGPILLVAGALIGLAASARSSGQVNPKLAVFDSLVASDAAFTGPMPRRSELRTSISRAAERVMLTPGVTEEHRLHFAGALEAAILAWSEWQASGRSATNEVHEELNAAWDAMIALEDGPLSAEAFDQLIIARTFAPATTSERSTPAPEALDAAPEPIEVSAALALEGTPLIENCEARQAAHLVTIPEPIEVRTSRPPEGGLGADQLEPALMASDRSKPTEETDTFAGPDPIVVIEPLEAAGISEMGAQQAVAAVPSEAPKVVAVSEIEALPIERSQHNQGHIAAEPFLVLSRAPVAPVDMTLLVDLEVANGDPSTSNTQAVEPPAAVLTTIPAPAQVIQPPQIPSRPRRPAVRISQTKKRSRSTVQPTETREQQLNKIALTLKAAIVRSDEIERADQ